MTYDLAVDAYITISARVTDQVLCGRLVRAAWVGLLGGRRA
jgi:hypothetical protein